MLWPKKNSYKEFDNEKKFLRLENSPLPHNFSNGPSLMSFALAVNKSPAVYFLSRALDIEVESIEDKTSTYVGTKFCQVLYCLEDNPIAAAVTGPDPGPARELFEVQQKILRCASNLMFINF